MRVKMDTPLSTTCHFMTDIARDRRTALANYVTETIQKASMARLH